MQKGRGCVLVHFAQTIHASSRSAHRFARPRSAARSRCSRSEGRWLWQAGDWLPMFQLAPGFAGPSLPHRPLDLSEHLFPLMAADSREPASWSRSLLCVGSQGQQRLPSALDVEPRGCVALR